MRLFEISDPKNGFVAPEELNQNSEAIFKIRDPRNPHFNYLVNFLLQVSLLFFFKFGTLEGIGSKISTVLTMSSGLCYSRSGSIVSSNTSIRVALTLPGFSKFLF